MEKNIDLNCDLGEWRTVNGSKKDEEIMPFISSCNIACGGHIGDDESMRKTILLAKKYGVAIGVHPSYPDKVNFGREVMDIISEELAENLISQIKTFMDIAEEEGVKLHHIKPHGALYNHAAKDEKIAHTLLLAIKSITQNTPVYLPENSISAMLAKSYGVQVFHEVFADRVYEDDLSLRSRNLENAILDDESDVIAQIRTLVFDKQVLTYSGIKKEIKADTICLHSDTPGAIQLAKTIHKFLTSHGVEIISA